jgi:hypothetical protein
MFGHGSNYYMKSVNQSGPQPEVSRRVFDKVSELNGAPGNEVQHFHIFDYLPLRTVLSVPEDATAYPRSNHIMTGAVLKWAKDLNSPNVKEAAKRAVHGLTDIIAEAETQVSGESNLGYGNFS